MIVDELEALIVHGKANLELQAAAEVEMAARADVAEDRTPDVLANIADLL